jgi:hypothetical protein
MNVISRIFELSCQWVDHWSPARLGFLVQAVLLLGIPTVLCGAVFERCGRSGLIQVLALVTGVLLSLSIPVERLLPKIALLKSWLAILSVCVLLFLPDILSRLVTPNLGNQRRLCVALYGLLLVLFLANFFSS